MNPEELIAELESEDFEFWLDFMMDELPTDIDTREGSIAYDAIAPTATALAANSIKKANVVRQSYTATAEGEFLDQRAIEHGTSRFKATYAQVTAKFLDDNNQPIDNVQVGDRFASIGDDPIFYTVKSINADLTGLMVAETAGTRANGYIDQVLPVTPNDSLSWAEIIEITVPARDEEDDDHLRERLLAADNWMAYGGNIADYQDMLRNIVEVGAAQIYPAWQGGSTAKLVILDNSLMPASSTLLKQVKEKIDPTDASGEGYGLAPIGHAVTVVAPEVVTVNVTVSIAVDVTKTLNEVKPQLQTAISEYFAERRKAWGKINTKTGRGYALTVYRSQILSAIMRVEGIVDASMPVLNGNNSDVVMILTNDKSQLPVLGDVTFTEEAVR
ncbi:baseplate J/gp47 family protein [Lentilactobacillus sp. Marseille-Q4993]|uniref:baseplate J/gp47 family protein n=1 Tax=Lentilactobacillus sp. Marseille-Q4993 TaxID=3039492 RepID=UPI0024BD08F8|nr:baseplate J/gp47 family protein [Lentilactobacillus sp. Marseille-Q4993]